MLFRTLVLRDELSNSKSVKNHVEMTDHILCGHGRIFRSGSPYSPTKSICPHELQNQKIVGAVSWIYAPTQCELPPKIVLQSIIYMYI